MPVFKALLQLLASIKHAQSKTPADFFSIRGTRVTAEQHWGDSTTAWITQTHSERNYRLAYPQWHIVKPLTTGKKYNNPHSYLWLILGLNIWTNIRILSLRIIKVSLFMQCLVNLKKKLSTGNFSNFQYT